MKKVTLVTKTGETICIDCESFKAISNNLVFYNKAGDEVGRFIEIQGYFSENIID